MQDVARGAVREYIEQYEAMRNGSARSLRSRRAPRYAEALRISANHGSST